MKPTAQRIILPRLHPAQIEIIQRPARFKVVSAGRRFGKGILGISEAFKRGIGGRKSRWISPTYASDSYQAGWGIAENLARQIPGVDVHFQRRTFDFSRLGGAWLQFRTSEEPDSLRGEGIDFCVFDEAAHVPALQTIWEQCVRPSLMDRRGDAWWISTPKGFNFFNTLHNRGRDGEPGWASFHFSSFDNPYLDRTEIEALRRDMPALVARQEIDAEFVQLSGALVKRESIIILDCEPTGANWIRSWDLAFTSKTTSDFTAGAKVGMTSDGTIVIADMVHGRWEWPEALRVISATAQLDGAEVRQGIECVGAQVGALQTLLRDPMLATFSFEPIQVHNDKLTRALPLVARSEQGKLAIVRGGWNQAFVDQLCSFPQGEHDDMVDAATGALTMLSERTGAITEADVDKIRIGRNELTDYFASCEVRFDDPPVYL